MKKFIIEITDTDVFINGKLCEFAHRMDKENHKDDMNKRAIVALANEMGYESVFLFEEMADRLNEMIEEDFDMNEMIKFWLTELYENEIEETQATISNENLWMLGSETKEEEQMHIDNMANLNEYIATLKTLLNDIKEAK